MVGCNPWLKLGIPLTLHVLRLMDDLQFYILFNSISVTSRGWADDNKRRPPDIDWNTVSKANQPTPWVGLKLETARSVGQRFPQWATVAPTCIGTGRSEQTVQTEIRLFLRSTLDRAYTVCHSQGCHLSSTSKFPDFSLIFPWHFTVFHTLWQIKKKHFYSLL